MTPAPSPRRGIGATPVDEVRKLLAGWANVVASRDIEKHADLYLRDPAPIVTWSDGERCDDWLDVRVRIEKDAQRAVIERLDWRDLDVRLLTDDVVLATFDYDLHVRDIWGTATIVGRHATLTLVRTKDGLRIAAAHHSLAA